MKKIIHQYSSRNKRLREHRMTYQEYLRSPFWLQVKNHLKQKPEEVWKKIAKVNQLILDK